MGFSFTGRPPVPQLDLFSQPKPAHTPAPAVAGRATSVQSGQEIVDAMPELRRQVLAFVRGKGAHGATDDEIQAALDLNPSTQRPRRVELERAGFVREAPGKLTRPTASGRQAIVWVSVPEFEREVVGERAQAEADVTGAIHHLIATLDLEGRRAALAVLKTRFPG